MGCDIYVVKATEKTKSKVVLRRFLLHANEKTETEYYKDNGNIAKSVSFHSKLGCDNLLFSDCSYMCRLTVVVGGGMTQLKIVQPADSSPYMRIVVEDKVNVDSLTISATSAEVKLERGEFGDVKVSTCGCACASVWGGMLFLVLLLLMMMMWLLLMM